MGFGVQNQAGSLFAEYMRRLQLKEIGFVDNYSSLPFWKAEAFAIINEELKKLEAKKAARDSKKKPRGGRSG